MRAKRAVNIFKIELGLLRAKRAQIFGKKLTLPLPQFYQVKVRVFIFFPEEDRLFISIIFKVSQRVPAPPPPPSESNGRPLTVVLHSYM